MNEDRIGQAADILRSGGMVIIRDDDDREAEGDFLAAASAIGADAVNLMVSRGRGLLCCAVDQGIARSLALNVAAADDSLHGTAFAESLDLREGASTGISCAERAACIRRMADPGALPGDFARPGHVFPLVARPGGVLERRGHTEAAVDLCSIAGLPRAGAICEILKDDGSMARGPELAALGAELGLMVLSVEEIARWRKANQVLVKVASSANIPTAWGRFDLHSLSTLSGRENPLLLTIGLPPPLPGHDGGFPAIQPELDRTLLRVHSECATGDLFGSLRCDCGQQLRASMKRIGREGRGAIVYLRQEGRGIGLEAKLAAYRLQDSGMDTADANIALGFPVDGRDYWEAAQAMRLVGCGMVRLLSNNPQKVSSLEENGLAVSRRLPLRVPPNPYNEEYLETKRVRFGHSIRARERRR